MKDVYVVSTVKVSVPDEPADHLHEALSYMSQNCANATLSDVATHVGMHPNTVGALLRRSTGKTFSQLIRTMRMARAAALLEYGKLPVLQVAHLCGYEDPRGFYRAFREEFGETPRDWTKAHRRADDYEPPLRLGA